MQAGLLLPPLIRIFARSRGQRPRSKPRIAIAYEPSTDRRGALRGGYRRLVRHAGTRTLRCPPHARAAGVAAHGDQHVRPLRTQHLHQCRVGRRPRTPRRLRPLRPRLPPVGRDRARRRHEGDRHHGQTPRRLLPLAQSGQRPHRRPQRLARRQGRRAARTLRRLPRSGPRVRRLHFAVGPQRSGLRHRRLQRRLPPHARERAGRLRRGLRTVVRRRLRRGPQRQAAGLRLGSLPLYRVPPPAAGRGLRRRRPRLPLDRQRAGHRGAHLLVDLRSRRGVARRGPFARHAQLRQRARQPLGAGRGRRLDPPRLVLPRVGGCAGQVARRAAQDLLRQRGAQCAAAAQRPARQAGTHRRGRFAASARIPCGARPHLRRGPRRGGGGRGSNVRGAAAASPPRSCSTTSTTPIGPRTTRCAVRA